MGGSPIHLSGSIVVIEAKASVSDANPTLIALDRKIRLAPEIVRQRGLPSGAIGGLLVITATTTNPET